MKFLFQPTHIATLVFFRIAFGILAFADVLGTWTYKHLYKKSFEPEHFHFKYYGFQWVHPLPEPFMSLLFIVAMVAAICIAIGKWYRSACVVFALSFSWFFFMEKVFYLNHGYLFMLVSILMFFLPADRALALDNIKRPDRRVNYVPWVSTGILAFMMGIVYFYGGIAKLNPDWLVGQPLKIWLNQKSDMFLIGLLLKQEWFAYFMSYGGLLLDLTIVFFLLWKRTRIAAFFFLIFFHCMNLILFKIGIFPYFSLVLSSLFFPPDWPLRFFNYLKEKFNWVRRLESYWQQKFSAKIPEHEALHISETGQKWITAVVVIFCLVHVTVPFRHHLFKGDVAWTEEGHRYSWRMMLRQKRGTGKFRLVFPDEDKPKIHYPSKQLSSRQYRKMITHPDMILQYAHYLRDSLQQIGKPDVEIYADIKLRLNQHKSQRYIDDKVNLAGVEWEMFRHADWILPFKREL